MKKFIALAIVLGVLTLSVPQAQAITLSDLKKEVEKLKGEILDLKSKITGQVLGSVAPAVNIYYKGMRSPEIAKFQQILINQKFLAEGSATGYFGDITYKAVLDFQKAKGLPISGVLDGATQTSLTAACQPDEISITVISPNGGEVYNTGEQMTVRWESCNLPATDMLNIFLAVPSMGWDLNFINNTINDGSETITIPENISTIFGNLFKIHIVKVNFPNDPPLDYSDNLFAINNDNPVQAGAESCKVGNEWTQKADFGGIERNYGVGFSIGTKGYIGTGSTTVSTFKKDFWEWDQTTNTWTQKADFGGIERWGAVGFSLDGKGYLGTGYNSKTGGVLQDFWEYNPSTNAWTKKADFGGGKRTQAVGISIGDKGYIGTGWNGTQITKDFWEYNPSTNAWTKKADFGGAARQSSAGFSIGTKGYIGTGTVEGATKDFWEYDPLINIWTRKADFGGTARHGAVGFSIGWNGYIGTGSSTKDFWQYNPSTNAWTKKADFGGGIRVGSVGFSIGDKGYLGTGYSHSDGVRKKDFWEYCEELPPPPDCTPNTWTQKADFLGKKRYGAAGFSIDTKGYIGTGVSSPGLTTLKDFWEWDQTTNTWTQKADFGGLARHKAVGFSIGNKGYIGTGYKVTSGPINEVIFKDFWEYDQATNIWTKKADFGGGGRNEATGFSIGTKGYIGTGTYDEQKKDFWEYDPVIDTWTRKADFGGYARVRATGFAVSGKGYIGLGYKNTNNIITYFADFWEYNPSLDAWFRKAPFPGSLRMNAMAFSIKQYGYVGGGSSDSGAGLPDFWRYDGNNNIWTQKTSEIALNHAASGFSIGGKGYVAGFVYSANFNPPAFMEYCPD